MKETGLFNAKHEPLTLSEVFNMITISTVTRVEVIDQKGRSYVNINPENKVYVSIQDDNRTMKIFISNK